MTEELDHKTFDIIAVLAGRDYPTLEVPVYFNEALGFELFKLEEKRRNALLLDAEEAKEIDEEYQKLVKSTVDEKYIARLKSIPEQIRRDIHVSVAKEFPTKKNFMGQEDINPEGDEAFTKKMWRAYLQAVVSPDGAVSLVDEATVTALYEQAPASFHEAVNGGIAELQTGSKAGFESAAKELNFLSDASPEG